MGELRDIKRSVGALLEGLGRSPDEVASSLEAAGVHGDTRSNSSCAVALYTAAVVQADPRIRSVAVGPCTLILTLVHPEDGRAGGRLVVQLPKSVRGFVDGFDAGLYPAVLRLQEPRATEEPGAASGRTAGLPEAPIAAGPLSAGPVVGTTL
jgi:hypothetical protein